MNLAEFSKSKRRVFDAAVELFARETFESVSMEDIARVLKMKKPSMYHHFASKQEILDIALEIFQAHFFDGALPVEQFDPLIAQGTLLEIVRRLIFVFAPEYDLLMQQVFRIIHQRKYHDPMAQRIYQEVVIDQSLAYGRQVLDRVVEKGRTAPFDTESFSRMLNYIRQGTYDRWVVKPTVENYNMLVAEETKIFKNMLLSIEDKQAK